MPHPAPSRRRGTSFSTPPSEQKPSADETQKKQDGAISLFEKGNCSNSQETVFVLLALLFLGSLVVAFFGYALYISFLACLGFVTFVTVAGLNGFIWLSRGGLTGANL